MAYNEQMTNRIREALADVPRVTEKRMFRGVSFMVNGKMCITAGDDEMMCRIDPAHHDEAVQKNGVRALTMKGREYRGFVYIHDDAMKSKKDFEGWIRMALDFNKVAKASPRKKKTVKKVEKKKTAKKTTRKKSR